MAEVRCRRAVLPVERQDGEEDLESKDNPHNSGDPVSHDDVDATDVGGVEGTQESVKKREEKDQGETKPVEEKTGEKEDETDKQMPSPVKTSTRSSRSVMLQRLVKLFFGCLAAVTCGMMYAVYLSTYHERKFWFSSRQELEREITFQGGSGLYYYYYKHMLTAPSFERGVYELTRDNRTVSGQTINVVERLSLYPELVTSLLYRVTGSQEVIEPVYFYIGMVFGLQALYVTALFVSSWVMSGTWVAGMLAVAWYVINRPDTTKVDYAIPLRDNWALPYFSCQVAALTGFLSNNINSATEMFCYLLMSATTFTFVLVWEHSHYVLFVQGLALFLLDSFDLVQPRKIADIHKVYLSSVFLAYVLQFQNPRLLSSPLLSLLVASVLARYFQPVSCVHFLSRTQAPMAAVFAGSPQLLGTVKLCSGWTVTSLPLFSDIHLLRSSEDTHQVYALRSAEDIYKILTSHKTNYVIVEESLCNELSHTKGCRIKDLLDISNGHVVYDKGEMYSFSKHGRFCHEIKLNYSPYTNYFTRVFWNRSYHIYKVNSVISFQY
ncbi:probable C-mannosyltransferase DPY19L4 [Osmerus eperlanus]|uniref:probable C-mannosyltransferase DPY19L4 n=1 Tax=Osmerus eperlanus TaxID=29151 RepID=UPI002E1128C5